MPSDPAAEDHAPEPLRPASQTSNQNNRTSGNRSGITTRSRSRLINQDLGDPDTDDPETADQTESDSDEEISFKKTPSQEPDLLEQWNDTITAPIDPPVIDIEEPSAQARRNTLIGHQLRKPINPLEVAEGTQVPVIPTDLINPNQGEYVFTPPDDLDMQELGPLFDEDTPIQVINKRIPHQVEMDTFIEAVKKDH